MACTFLFYSDPTLVIIDEIYENNKLTNLFQFIYLRYTIYINWKYANEGFPDKLEQYSTNTL